MKTIISIAALLFLLGCGSDIKYLKGEYGNLTWHDYEKLTFEDTVHFQYFFRTVNFAFDYVYGNGTYQIKKDTLQLKFGSSANDPYFVSKYIESVDTDSDSILVDIYFKESHSSLGNYHYGPYSFGIISVYDSNKVFIRTDTADINGHLSLKYKKSNDLYLFEILYKKSEKDDSSFSIRVNTNYRIPIFIFDCNTHEYDGETVNFQIKSISEKSLKIKKKFGAYRAIEFLREEEKKK